MSVKLYINPLCGFCKQTEGFLRKHCIPYERVDVTTNEGRIALDALRFNAVPILLVNETIIKGYSPRKLNEIFNTKPIELTTILTNNETLEGEINMAQFPYSFSGNLNFLCTDYAIQNTEETSFMIKLVQKCSAEVGTNNGIPILTYMLVNAATQAPFGSHTVNGTFDSTADEIWFYNVPAGTWYLYIANDGSTCGANSIGDGSLYLNGYVNSTYGTTVANNGSCPYLGN